MIPPRRMRCVSRTLVPLAGLIALLAPIPADARILTEDAEVPVEVADVKGEVVKQSVKVRIYRDDARARSPFMILNHGRSADAEKRRALDLNVLATNARYLAGKGFAVFVPVRVGYGVTGGPDVEDSGPCSTKIYGPAYEAGTVQSLAIIGHARARPFVDPDSGIAMGQSFGGTIAIALAAKGAPGIRAAVRPLSASRNLLRSVDPTQSTNKATVTSRKYTSDPSTPQRGTKAISWPVPATPFRNGIYDWMV